MSIATTLSQEHVRGVFDRSDFADDTPHEQVVFCRDADSGLRAIIAIHSIALGPALGGTRFHPYVDEHAALTDVLRLSRGMTYKASVAGVALGGGKAVIIGDPTTAKTPELLRAYGRFVESLNGRYITAGDVGTTSEDMDVIGQTTNHVVARTEAAGGSGDSAPLTALGVYRGIQAAAEHVWGSADLTGRVVGVEGTGKVGLRLAELILEAGASVVATDVDPRSRQRIEAELPAVRTVDSLHGVALDVYAPCAMGGSLTERTAATLDAEIVCGAANNQLHTSDAEVVLRDRRIVWVPDFVANSGGLIHVAGEIDRQPRDVTVARVDRIRDTTRMILESRASHDGLAGRAALALAWHRLEENARDHHRGRSLS
jgi:valine dehydrogenase (NAD+)